MQANSTKRFLSRADVARELGIGLHAVDRAIRRGELPAMRLGGRILISRIRFEEWLQSAQEGVGQRDNQKK